MKILLIEDQNQLRNEISDWLTFEGYEVFAAENGKVGIEIALQEHPDLIISDIRMPVMDGHEVLKEIRSNPILSGIPFLFITASAEKEGIELGMNLGADEYIIKPFTHNELISAIKTRLR